MSTSSPARRAKPIPDPIPLKIRLPISSSRLVGDSLTLDFARSNIELQRNARILAVA